MRPTILVDASPLGGGVTGAGRYSYRLLNALLPMDHGYHFDIIVPKERDRSWSIDHWKDHTHVSFIEMSTTNIGPKRQLSFALSLFDFDLFHSLSSFAPLLQRGNLVTTIHDLKNFDPQQSFLKDKPGLKEIYIQKVMEYSMKRSDHILTVSEYTKKDIQKYVDVPSDSITVTPLGPGTDPIDVDDEPPLSAPYLFFVGTVRPHKNLERLIEAFDELVNTYGHDDLELVIAGGDYDGHTAELRSKVPQNQRERVHFVGKVSEHELAVWYSHATVFVYPSLYEGFGLPPLEAMGYGVPVAVTDRTSVPEVVGDAGVYFDPTDPSEMAEPISEILSSNSLRTKLIEAGHERYKAFTWDRTARMTAEVYDAILGECR